MKKDCISCGSKKHLKYRYKNRQKGLSVNLKNIAKIVLPYLDRFIPESAARLKRVSSKRDTSFDGYVLVCPACGYGTLNKPPNEDILSSYYTDCYWNNREKLEYWLTDNPDDYKLDLRSTSQLEFVNEYLVERTLSNILEIGAGTAWPLQHLRIRFPSATIFVCEPAKQMDEYYSERSIQRIADFFPFRLRFEVCLHLY